jgi:hypothetical protein
MSIKGFFYQQDSRFLEEYFRQYIQRNITEHSYTKRAQQITINKIVNMWPNKMEKEVLQKLSLEFL